MIDEPFCASSAVAAQMSDEEFWAHVFPQPESREEPDIDDYPELVVGFCLRCGGNLIAEDYQQLRWIIDQDRELCDECADALLPDVEETY